MKNPFELCVCSALAVAALIGSRATADERQAELKEREQAAADLSAEGVRDLLQDYCIECHCADAAEAGLRLDTFMSVDDVAKSVPDWKKIADRLQDFQMPPPEHEAPSASQRVALVGWIRSAVHSAVCDDGVSAGPPQLRRLNRTEYANTMRDLLGIQVHAGHALPEDGGGGEGFDNAAEILFISPIHAEKYLDAARSALGHAFRDPGDRRAILIAEPNEELSPTEAARQVLSAFLRRAFRRPISEQELDDYCQLFALAYEDTQSFELAIQFPLEAALVSPKFLFLFEEAPSDGQEDWVSQYEMASRLSYFLWASMPDQELLDLAEAGRLHDKTVLTEQVARMLHSETNRRGLRPGAKVREFATSFIEQWLGTRALGREFKPDAVAGAYDSELEGGLKYEPIFFFEDILSENRSLLNLIDADYTYVNRRLARHYGVAGEFREQPKFVELPEDSPRGGLLGMGAVLAVSSFPHRTSPVLRGKWIMETLLGTPPPPPPPNVPALDEGTPDGLALSARERLAKHREDAACSSCHALMDPLGFGLENFGVLGDWRTAVDGTPVDAHGELPDGSQFNGPEELKQLLLDRKQQFLRHFTSKMLGYALGRGLTSEDACVVEDIVRKLEQDEFRAQTLIVEIVTSTPFMRKRAGLSSP
ncbi:MAG: DUF1592 domain-containing protein [Pirellulaceae bacterium]